MIQKWTGDVVGIMHNYRISNKDLARELGVTDRYVSMVLCEKRSPDGAEQRFREAVQRIIEREAQDNGL